MRNGMWRKLGNKFSNRKASARRKRVWGCKYGKQIGYKGLSCFLVMNFICLLLAGCGADSASAPNGRRVLTAVVPSSGRGILERISDWNKNNNQYFIEVKDYGEEGSILEADEFATRLTLDILSGKGPDLVVWDTGYWSPALASEKLMVDLYDFMDADPDFHREDYYENILQAFEMNGGLYTMPVSFQIDTVCGKAEEIGTDRGVTESWELGEMIEAFENSPHAEWLTSNHSKDLTFLFVCQGCIGNYVDWGSGECRFDTPEFARLLEFSDTFPSQPMFGEDFSYYGILRSGKVFWEPVSLSSPWRVADLRISFGDADMRWPGYPVADGEKDMGGGVASPTDRCFSICRNSDDQAGAWEFIKSYLTEDAQRDAVGIPLLRSVSEERIREALTIEYETVDGMRREKVRDKVMAEGEDPVELTCITEEDAAIYRSIIENTRRSYSNDAGMMEIIREEAGVYFEKDRNAAEVADIIQNRVSIYVSERME
ncbi:MAG: extracellular solute-binding protein [Lachnospiraceae bacterium]|nr:extracellular solute-binding protein [Butyrivibrio sp.]MCM1343146.1 extracellular solute-binding protein [Muribaculaceae bacterium]MCM1411554.1 extracellular solute-binding protein [Lachnospiraceae bacterium]